MIYYSLLSVVKIRVAWTKDGMDTSEEEDVWDQDAYYAHLDNLDFD